MSLAGYSSKARLGIGKTTVRSVGLGVAAQCGIRVLTSRPGEAESSLSYAGVADLLADVEDDLLDVLPGPQRHALDIALLRRPPVA
jgi:hypothetical protein